MEKENILQLEQIPEKHKFGTLNIVKELDLFKGILEELVLLHGTIQ